MASKAQLAKMASKAQLAPRVNKEQRVLKGNREQLAQMALQALKENRVSEDWMVPKVILARLVREENRV